MHHPDDEALIQQIQPVLELDHQYTRHVEAWNDDLVAQIRRCGRAAGRRLGYKVRTFASDPRDRDDRRIVVWVVVLNSSLRAYPSSDGFVRLTWSRPRHGVGSSHRQESSDGGFAKGPPKHAHLYRLRLCGHVAGPHNPVRRRFARSSGNRDDVD